MDDFTVTQRQLQIGEDNYWLAKSPAVRALRLLAPGSQERTQLAGQLTAQGYIIDGPIDVAGQNAPQTMMLRLYVQDLPWTSSFAQPLIDEGPTGPTQGSMPPFSPYDRTATHLEGSVIKPGPVGSVATVVPSLVPPPPPPTPIPGKELVGAVDNGAGQFSHGPGIVVDSTGVHMSGPDGPVPVETGMLVDVDRKTVVVVPVPGGYVGTLYHWPFGSGIFFVHT